MCPDSDGGLAGGHIAPQYLLDIICSIKSRGSRDHAAVAYLAACCDREVDFDKDFYG
jgi:hypothetical protein